MCFFQPSHCKSYRKKGAFLSVQQFITRNYILCANLLQNGKADLMDQVESMGITQQIQVRDLRRMAAIRQKAGAR